MAVLADPPCDGHLVLQSLSRVLEVAYDFRVPLPDGKLENICLTLHDQVRDGRSCTTHPGVQRVQVPGTRETQLMAVQSPALLVSPLLAREEEKRLWPPSLPSGQFNY